MTNNTVDANAQIKNLDANQIREFLVMHSFWSCDENNTSIYCTLTFANFAMAMEFLQRVGDLAENLNHHPDLFLHDYKYLTITLSTHSSAGITLLDLQLAEKIDEMYNQKNK